MCSEEHDVLLRAEAQQARTHQWTTTQIERLSRLFTRATAHFCLALLLGKLAQILQRQAKRNCFLNHLYRTSIFGDKSSAQYFVPAHDLVECLFEGSDVEATAYAQRERNVVSSRARRELIDEPEALLCE